MRNQPSHDKVDYSLAKKVLRLLVIAGLLAFPTIFVGQTLVGYKPGSDHHPNVIATTLGWANMIWGSLIG